MRASFHLPRPLAGFVIGFFCLSEDKFRGATIEARHLVGPLAPAYLRTLLVRIALLAEMCVDTGTRFSHWASPPMGISTAMSEPPAPSQDHPPGGSPVAARRSLPSE